MYFYIFLRFTISLWGIGSIARTLILMLNPVDALSGKGFSQLIASLLKNIINYFYGLFQPAKIHVKSSYESAFSAILFPLSRKLIEWKQNSPERSISSKDFFPLSRKLIEWKLQSKIFLPQG